MSSGANRRKTTEDCKIRTREGVIGGGSDCNGVTLDIFLSPCFSKAEMELKRKQEEEDRKKRAEEEKVMQVWTLPDVIHHSLNCGIV